MRYLRARIPKIRKWNKCDCMWTCVSSQMHIRLARTLRVKNHFFRRNIYYRMHYSNGNLLIIWNRSGDRLKTCPECRQQISLEGCRRVYFNFVGEDDSMQHYIDHLDSQYKAQACKIEEMKAKHALELRRKNDALDKMKKKAEKYKKKIKEAPLYPKHCECMRPMWVIIRKPIESISFHSLDFVVVAIDTNAGFLFALNL